jgi:uncharacterized protein
MPLRARWWTSRWWMMLPLLMLAASAMPVAAAAAEPNFPVLSGRVVDDAGVLDAATTQNLTGMLAKHEQTTGEQVVVVTLKSLGGNAIEDYGYQLGRKWGIGQKGKNTGALLLVVPSEHKVRIEVGYGLEGKLTDAISRTIIEGDILPNFRRGDYNAGVLAGTTSILSVLSGGSVTGTEAETSNGSPNAVGVDSGWRFPALMMIFIIFMFIRNLFRPRSGIYRRMGRGYGYGGFGGGGSGDGGGGFSGGGGSFGGGGASGSW